MGEPYALLSLQWGFGKKTNREGNRKEWVVGFPVRLIWIPEALAQVSAFHEAGHALVNDGLQHPMGQLLSLSILPGSERKDQTIGSATFAHDEVPPCLSLEQVIHRMAVMLGGMVAQEIWGFSMDSGCSMDLRDARMLATQAVVSFGLVDDPMLRFVRINEHLRPELTPNQEECVREIAAGLMEEAWKKAREILENPKTKAMTHDIAQALLKHGSLNRDQFLEMTLVSCIDFLVH
jgi:ATP-dependent Zn protease